MTGIEKHTQSSVALRLVDRLTVAATLMGETRGESYQGKVAVAWVIRNRMEKPMWWGLFSPLDVRISGVNPPRYSAEAVCRKRFQFSCWNSNDPSFPICQKFVDASHFQTNLLNHQFSDCLKAVEDVFSGKTPDPTDGATHYLNPRVCNPTWDDEAIFCGQIGAHKFYKGVK